MMRLHFVLTLCTLSLVALCAEPFAQERRTASPPGSSATEVGGHFDIRQGYVDGQWIEVRYGRPIKRGRDLFGPADHREALNDGAPVWRAGANVSTRLITDVTLVFGTTKVEPGEYTVFVDLQPTEWIFIISTWPAQITYEYGNHSALWGAYEYTSDRDVVRLPMTIETLSRSFDQLSWQFLDMSDAGGTLALLWDTKLASVPFNVSP